MINPRSRSLEWITEVAQKMGVRDKALMEKTIRAFSLLEALARSPEYQQTSVHRYRYYLPTRHRHRGLPRQIC